MRILLCCTVLLAGCGGPTVRPVDHAGDTPQVRGTARVQERIAELIVEARERGVSSDEIHERWLSDELALLAIGGETPSARLVWGGGERAFTDEELNRPDDAGCGASAPAPFTLEVDGDPSEVAVVRGGAHTMLITTANGSPEVSSFECAFDGAIEPSACGPALTCRRDGALMSVGGLWRDHAIVLDDPCARLLMTMPIFLRAAPQHVTDEGERVSRALSEENDRRRTSARRCPRPPAAELARARAAIERLIAATPPDPEGSLVRSSPSDFEQAWQRAEFSCRHPRARSFAVRLEESPHVSVWWVTDDAVVEIARNRIEGDEIHFASWTLIDLDGDRVDEVGVNVQRYTPVADSNRCPRRQLACETTLLSGSWTLDQAPRLTPCVYSAGIDPEHGPLVFGENAQPYVLREGRLVAAEAGFDTLRAVALSIREAPSVVARIEARLLGPDAAPLDCASRASLREDLEQRLRMQPSVVDSIFAGLPDCP
jgi:hypothetical protein